MVPLQNGDRAAVQELTTEVAVLTERLHSHTEASNKALALQAKEYERRLEEANNAISRADRLANTYVTRELHDKFSEDIIDKIVAVTAQISEINSELASWQARLLTLAYAITGIVSTTGVIVTLWHLLHS